MSETATTAIEISVTQEHYPPYDAAHGTPNPMVRRLLTLKLPTGAARFEQPDYGHPGRTSCARCATPLRHCWPSLSYF